MQLLIAIELQEQLQKDLIATSYKNIETLKVTETSKDIDSMRIIEESSRKVEKLKKTLVKQQDLDLKFISTISGVEKGNSRKPDRGMVRHQIMELIVRILEEKYIKTSVYKTFTEAMEVMWEEHLYNDFSSHNY